MKHVFIAGTWTGIFQVRRPIHRGAYIYFMITQFFFTCPRVCLWLQFLLWNSFLRSDTSMMRLLRGFTFKTRILLSQNWGKESGFVFFSHLLHSAAKLLLLVFSFVALSRISNENKNKLTTLNSPLFILCSFDPIIRKIIYKNTQLHPY